MDTSLDPNERIWRLIRARGLDPVSPGADDALSFLGGGGRLLDAGCGGGRVARGARSRYGRVVGLDVSPTALEIAASKGIECVGADLARGFAPFADRVFDAVSCLDAIEHFPDPAAVLSEIHRVLRPGGRLVLTTVNIRYAGYRLASLGGKPLRTADLSALGAEFADAPDGHVSFFTRASLERALGARGFVVSFCEGRQPAVPRPLGSRPLRWLMPARWRRDLFCRGLIAVAEKPCERGPDRVTIPGAHEPAPRGAARISSVIVNWNTRTDLEACLESVERAGRGLPGGCETIVVDNGSPDGSADLVRDRHPAATLVRNRFNLGFGLAANQGIRRASAPFVLVLNPDVRIDEGTLSILLGAMEAHPTLGAVGPVIEKPGGGRAISDLHEPSARTLFAWFLDRRGLARLAGAAAPREPAGGDLVDVAGLLGGCLLLRMAAIDRRGPFDERFFLYAEDLDLCRRLRAGGWRVAFDRRARAVHSGGRAAARDPERAGKEWIRSHRLFYWKHGMPFSRAIFEILVGLDRALGRFSRGWKP